jgi:hypothetical protein
MLSIIFVALVGLAGRMSDAEMPKNSLYDRLGGQPAIIAMVVDFIGKVASYNRIKPLGYLTPAQFAAARNGRTMKATAFELKPETHCKKE